MLTLKVSIGAILTISLLGLTSAQQLTYDERCQVIEGNGVRVDQCDATKLLACKDGRCQCSDPANQIYTYRLEPVAPSRSKRSPGKKGSGFKKIAAGAVAGVATYHVAKTVGKGVKNGFTTTEAPPKMQKVFSCYSRVGGQCQLNYNNWESVTDASITTTSSTTTTAAPTTAVAGNETVSDNSTTTTTTSTTTAAPVAAAQKMDISKIPRCVQYAVCKQSSPATNGTASAGFLQKVDFDPRVGVCECDAGYKRTTKDLCVRESSGAGKTVGSAATAVILASLLINKIFV